MIFASLSTYGPASALQLLMDWAMPQSCVLCAARSGAEAVCVACEAALTEAPATGQGIAVHEYRFPLDRLVQRFKSSGDLAVGRWLAVRLAHRVANEPRPDLLVAPPLTSRRLRERGFNQSLEIARVVGSRLGVPRVLRGVRKVRETPPQQGLGRRERRRNVRDAFRCSLPLAGRRVAIVDDVITTGATVGALARELRRAGARDVVVWTLARAPAPGRR